MNRLQERIRKIADHHGSLRAAASVLKIDHGYLSRLLGNGKTNPSDKVLRKLGLMRVTLYIDTNERLLNYAVGELKCQTKSKSC